MNSQMRNKRGGQSKNTASTCRMNVYTNSKRSLPKEPNQEFSNYHRGHPHIRSHLWPLNTHNTRQVDQKFPWAPQDHPKDNLAPSHDQTPPTYRARHGFSIFNGSPFLHTKSRKIYFRWVQACNSRVKPEIIMGLKQVRTKYKDRGFFIANYYGNNGF